MPQVKKNHYFRGKYNDLNRFISYFYQIQLATEAVGHDIKKIILEVGVGNRLVADYLVRLGFRVTTCDIDEELKPDVIADIRNLLFHDNQFDLVLAFEVLEHLPFSDFRKALDELKRVSGEYVIISLLYRRTGLEFVLKFPFIRSLFGKKFLDFFIGMPLVFRGFETSGQHHWEMDFKQYSLRHIRSILSVKFQIIKETRPVLNSYHYFFVLKK
mgnify:CR=1 FL=1